MYIDSFMFGGGFEIMFTLIFITVFGLIIFTIIRGIGEWNKNNQSPRLTVEASIVAKRTHVSRHTHYRRSWHSYDFVHQLLRNVSGGERRPHGAVGEKQ